MLNSAAIQVSMELWGAIFCIMFASFVWIGEKEKTSRSRLLVMMLLLLFSILVSDSVAIIYRGEPGTFAFYAVRISNFLVFALNYAIGVCALLYLEAILNLNQVKLNPHWKGAIIANCALGFGMVVYSQFTGFLYTIDSDNLYHRAGGYLSICIVAGVMVILVIAVTMFYYRKVPSIQIKPLLRMFCLALLATVIQSIMYGISLVNLALVVGVVIMYFAYEREIAEYRNELQQKLLLHDLQLANQEKKLMENNLELAEQRIQVMAAQIQPHFLYNALSAISSLCVRDPMKARETVENFAFYLRANLGNLNKDGMISFAQELEHTQAYLAIEQVRFGEDLTVEYDIQCDDFSLPALTVEPIVENAVRYGICGSEDAGTVLIRTERKDGRVIITIKDNGVGFDTSALSPKDGRKHIGVENVTQRIRSLCGGNVVIDSTPGYGTTATIILPETNPQ